MKVLLISSMALKTPPQNYGGLERVWYEHAAGLAKLGHDITLAGSKGSRAPLGVKLIETVPSWDTLNEAQRKQYAKSDRVWNGWRAHEEEAYQTYKENLMDYDIIGDASWAKWSYLSKKEEIIGTCHSVKSYNVKPPREFSMLTGVSRGHARFLSRELGVPVRTLWNPVNIEDLPFQQEKSERVLSFNRIMPQKGIHLFVSLVEKWHFKADIAGDDSTLVSDQNYVQSIKQACAKSAYLNYHGLIDEKARIKLLQNAKCLVCLKDAGYEEVFGLQAVEALSVGTPVIALKSWGFEDTIINGENGYLCDNIDQVADAINRVENIKPTNCRKSAERFSRERIAKVYEHLLIQVRSGCRW